MKNKQKWLWIISIIVIGFVVASCADDNVTTATHKHAWGEWAETTPATCMAEGLQTRACSGCTATETEVIDINPTAHDMQVVDGGVNKPATCTETGIGKMACDREGCNHTEDGGTIPKIPHTLQPKDGGTVTIASTCTTHGEGEVKCVNCTHEEIGELPLDPDNHDWGTWHIAAGNHATCRAKGERYRDCLYAACTVPSDKEEIPVDDVNGHNYVYDGQSVAPNCVDRGSGTATCSICDDVRIEGDYDPTPNNHKSLGTVFQVTKPATCIEVGESYLFCTACEKHDTYHASSYQEVPVNPANHDLACTPAYIITGSVTAFTANFTYSLCTGSGTAGTANQTITNTLTAIRTHADGAAVTIQFGDGTNVLNIGSVSASFNNTGGEWGLITFTGRITTGVTTATIVLSGNVSINSTADITNTNGTIDARGMNNAGTGTVNINGGTISARTVVRNGSTGTVNINGGTLTTTGSALVLNESGGTVNITGSTFSSSFTLSTTGISNTGTGTVNITGGTFSSSIASTEISNTGTGTVNISGVTLPTNGRSTVINSGSGKIIISGSDITSIASNMDYDANISNRGDGTIEITGSTITNTNTTGRAKAIYNGGAGTITISDAVITSADTRSDNGGGGTIVNAAGGSIGINGGTITNTANNANANAICNRATGTVTLSNCTVQANAHASAHAIRNVTEDASLITFGSGVTILGNLLNCPAYP